MLPQWLQWVALAMPTARTFEAMRAALIDGQARWDLLAWSLAIAVTYLALAQSCSGNWSRQDAVVACCCNGE